MLRSKSIPMLRSGRSSALATPDSTPTKSAPAFNDQAKFAYTGYSLLQVAALESQNGAPSQNTSFPRQIYVDSVSYLLRGLPEDLTSEEAQHIRKAIPTQIEDHHGPLCLTHDPSQPPHAHGRRTAAGSAEEEPTLLHRVLASAIVISCLLIRFLAPYIKRLFASAYRFEQAHHLTEKFFSSTMGVADSAGKRVIQVAGTVLGHDVVMKGLVYLVDGIRTGLAEGLGQGIKIMENDGVAGQRRQPP